MSKSEHTPFSLKFFKLLPKRDPFSNIAPNNQFSIRFRRKFKISFWRPTIKTKIPLDSFPQLTKYILINLLNNFPPIEFRVHTIN